MANVSLKKALANLLTKKHTTPYARYSGSNGTAVANSNVSSTGTYYQHSSFTGYSTPSFSTNDSKYFAYDVNGIKILRHGIYKFEATTHLNQVSGGGMVLAFLIHKYTNGSWSGLGSTLYYIGGNYVGGVQTVIAELSANEVVAPRVNRYSTGGSGTKWRPAFITCSAVLLQDLELDPWVQGD